MNRKPVGERGPCHALRITGFARAFEPMHEHKLPSSIGVGLLFVHQHLHTRFGFVKDLFAGPALVDFWARPEVACDRREMRVAEERKEIGQITAFQASKAGRRERCFASSARGWTDSSSRPSFGLCSRQAKARLGAD